MTNAETQLASYFAKYEPAIAKLGKALRGKLRARLPKLADLQPHRNAENSLTWRRFGRSRLFGRTGLFLSGQLFEQRTKCIQFGTEATPVSGF